MNGTSETAEEPRKLVFYFAHTNPKLLNDKSLSQSTVRLSNSKETFLFLTYHVKANL